MHTLPTSARLALLERSLLPRAWFAASSNDPDNWTPLNPAWGQCAVTALVVQDICGGRLLRCVATLPGHRHQTTHLGHYKNLIDGREVDLTRRQFPPGTRFSYAEPKRGGHASTRAYLLSNPETARRYRKLREALTVLAPTLIAPGDAPATRQEAIHD
ncbi:hypothetical protein CKO28_00445 [Rhodovibrio sodomensis]|uniref:Uncharacterized protein n=1 Tax=Rhodovibrio sodomensis TaxID=1088 RepID=A0ABS1D8E3_9PROT|nr:hypothetical protein [Rhodovibrio sodomensis]MBK1666509.1 hypothetical protein [Rhodovibrio sodomensis]